MKALITIIDDDGNVLRTNKLISPMRTKFDGMADIYEFSFKFVQARSKTISFDCLFSNEEEENERRT